MPADILTAPPADLRAGDTATWRRALGDYPAAAGWQLKYTLVGAGGAYNLTATADGDDYVVAATPATTAGWVAGSYVLTEYVTNGTDRFTLASTTVRVLADLAAATTPSDTRTHARKVLDAIEAWLESKAPTAAKFEIAGRRLENYPLADLLSLRDRYRAEVRREVSGGGSRMLVSL